MNNQQDIKIIFDQLHIDVARNATDDFNLFHDPHQWHLIEQNPFSGPIVLGFQLEALVENHIANYRSKKNELDLLHKHHLDFSNYQFNFANAVKPGQTVTVDIKTSQYKSDNNALLSNRVAIKADHQLALMGFKKESSSPLFLASADFSDFGDLNILPDRSYIAASDFFLKRKFMMTSNAKNFLCGAFTDQSHFFDELNEKAEFPEMFPCSLISCALLEKAHKNHHDFKKNPMVYTSHKISLNRKLLSLLKSNDALHILVRTVSNNEDSYECYGLIRNNEILFRGLIGLTSLQNILTH